jgi:hypothetical protein
VCSTGPSCSLMGPRWLIYPILSYPCSAGRQLPHSSKLRCYHGGELSVLHRGYSTDATCIRKQASVYTTLRLYDTSSTTFSPWNANTQTDNILFQPCPPKQQSFRCDIIPSIDEVFSTILLFIRCYNLHGIFFLNFNGVMFITDRTFIKYNDIRQKVAIIRFITGPSCSTGAAVPVAKCLGEHGPRDNVVVNYINDAKAVNDVQSIRSQGKGCVIAARADISTVESEGGQLLLQEGRQHLLKARYSCLEHWDCGE